MDAGEEGMSEDEPGQGKEAKHRGEVKYIQVVSIPFLGFINFVIQEQETLTLCG